MLKVFKQNYIMIVLLILAFFVRVFRVDQILGFYFDQGRDAMEIWELLHFGDIFLIGPTTGIAGIFRGPFYYYLITPFYWAGGGDPIWPAIFLAATTVIALWVLYYLGSKYFNKSVGLIAVILGGFSFYIVYASRWLSNPTPMLLLSTLLIWAMILVTQGKKWAWIAIAGLTGTSLFHFGSSGEFFYFPAILVFAIWQRKNLPTLRIFLVSVFVFFLTAAPLIIFDFKNRHILTNNIQAFLFEKESFKTDFQTVFQTRMQFYYDVFISKIFHNRGDIQVLFLRGLALAFVLLLPKLLKNKLFKILCILLLSPIVGLLFFQGNEGNVYDYYLTGYYLVFLLLVAVILGTAWKYTVGKVFVVYFLALFLIQNLEVVRNYITSGVDGPQTIAYGNQKQALDWIYEDANGQPFSIDVYVPPVIPYAYNYLFAWYGGEVKGYPPSTEQINPLYTLYEEDPPHPERLEAWMDRQRGIGKVEHEAKFGGITVQRRTRI